MFPRDPGRGRRGAASQGSHCVPPALAAPDHGPGSGERPQEQKRREGKGEAGDTLAGSEPGRGGRGGSNAKSQRPGRGWGLRWAGLPWPTGPLRLTEEGRGRLEKQEMAKPGQGRIKVLYLP